MNIYQGSACDWKQYGYEIPCGCEAHLICKSQICVDPTKQATKSTQPTRQQPTLAPTERTTQQTSGGSGRCKSVCGADQCCQETVKTVQITTPGIKFQWTPQNPDRSPYLCAPKNVAVSLSYILLSEGDSGGGAENLSCPQPD